MKIIREAALVRRRALRVPASCLVLALALASGCGDDASPGGGAASDVTDTTADATPDATTDATTDTALPDAQPDALAGDTVQDSGAPDAAPDATPDATPDAAPDAVDAIDAAADSADADAGPTPPNPDCDPLDPSACALPWPSNLYLVPDPARVTGHTLTFGPSTLPANTSGKHIDPSHYTQMDGYSPAGPLLVHFPRLDESGLPGEYHTNASLEPDAQILWFEVTPEGLVRVPYWAELDKNEPDVPDRVLFVQPAVILKEATRYVVAFRDLTDTDGAPIQPSEAFVKLRDGATADDPLLAPRQARFDEIFGLLDAEGVEKGDLIIAWDFVTASSDAMHGRMLHMRDDALSIVGEDGPELTITEVEEFTPEQNAEIAVELRGTFRVPNYMDEHLLEDGTNAYTMHVGPDGMPTQNGWSEPDLWIRIPRSALSGTPHGLVHYGHGQNGHGSQVRGGFNSKIANKHHFIFFANDMLGMSGDDVPAIIGFTKDLSDFRWLSDRLHQGLVNHVLLARAMRERFPELEEVVSRGIVVNKDELFYSGISQGGIYGASYVALSPDVTRGHLGVPGNHYALLLHRSGNFGPFFAAVSISYPKRMSQAILLQAVQLQWDGADPVTYYRHITAEPFEGNEPHHVLVVPAKGDKQVAVVTNEIVARSEIGIPLLAHYDDERVVDGAPEQPYPHVGSGVVLYDFGNPWPTEQANLPPKSEVEDPHEGPRQLEYHNDQMVHFFRTGEIIDVCGGDGCHPD